MNVPNTPETHILEPYDPAGYLPLGRDVAKEIMDAVRRDLAQMQREGKVISLPRSYTITEAADKTGRPRNEIYLMIRRREIEARMNTDGPALWLTPEEEVEQLMPDPAGNVSTSGPAEAPSDVPNLITNNNV